MQARLYAEDVANGFRPATGKILRIDLPAAPVRADMGVRAGEEIGPHYDPMIGKLVSHGNDRAEALGLLRAALGDTAVLGVPTNLDFLKNLLARPEVADGSTDTELIDREVAPRQGSDGKPPDELFALAGAVVMLQYRDGPNSDPWQSPGGFTNWRLGRHRPRPSPAPVLQVSYGLDTAEVAFSPYSADGSMLVRVAETLCRVILEPLGDGAYSATLDNKVQEVRALVSDGTVYLDGPFGTVTARVALGGDGWRADAAAVGGRLLAPVMGQVTKVHVAIGDRVNMGDVLVVQESMKMEIRLTAPCDGVVRALACAEGDMIERHDFVVEVQPLDAAS